jgi:hypothetical protein
MAEKFRTPVPRAPLSDAGLIDWARQLVAWLQMEPEPEEALEEILALGGLGVSSRLFGFEGEMAAAGTPTEILSAPVAPRKKIVVWLAITRTATPDAEVRLLKRKGGSDYEIFVDDIGDQSGATTLGAARIVLDDDDESLMVVSESAEHVHWDGSYLDVE